MKPRASAQAPVPPDPTHARGARVLSATVRGERGTALIARALSARARATHYLALGLMLAIGAGLLLWYYSHQFSHHGRRRQGAVGAARLAATEMTLPPLGPLDAPRLGPALLPVLSQRSSASASSRRPYPAPLRRLAPTAHRGLASAAATPDAAAAPTHPSALQRRLSAQVLFAAPAGPQAAPLHSQAPPAAALDGGARPGDRSRDELSALLRAPATSTASARLLPDSSLLLPKGSFIDCTLETAIDSTLPGMTTCITATDIFGADGRVVLMERGTKLVGETRGQVQQGAARVFVLWTEARTPDGVVVPLDSPGADQLGRAGLPGKVQRHFWHRFGAAILVSSIDGAVQATVQAANRGNGAVIYDPGATQDVMTEVLKQTVAIAPTVIKRNGDRIQVLVARDLDFSSVYELRDTNRGR